MIILTKNVHPSHDYRLKWVANDDALFFIYCCIFSEFLLFMFSFASLSSLILKSHFFSSCLFNLFPFSVQSANNLFCSQNDYLAETYLSHYSSPCKVSLEYGVFLGSQISPHFVYTFVKIASALSFSIWATNYMDIHAS